MVNNRSSDVQWSIGLAVLLLAIPLVIVLTIVFWLLPTPWWLGVLVGLAIAGGLVLMRIRNADQVITSALGGGLLQADGAARLENLVQGLSLAGGVEEPEVVVLSDPARNAMAVRNRGRNRIVLTQGLLESLEVVELEGVVAELLTRLKNGDAEAATLGAALFGQPILDGPLNAVLAPLAKLGLGRLLSDDRDLQADRQAVQLTRYPPGLHGAFRKMGEGVLTPKAYTPGLAHLWLVDPDQERQAAQASDGADGQRAPLGLRIDVLAEL